MKENVINVETEGGPVTLDVTLAEGPLRVQLDGREIYCTPSGGDGVLQELSSDSTQYRIRMNLAKSLLGLGPIHSVERKPCLLRTSDLKFGGKYRLHRRLRSRAYGDILLWEEVE